MSKPTARTKRWQLQQAKAQLSRLIKEAQQQPQIITLHGQEVAVVQSMNEYLKTRRQDSDAGPNLYEALLKCPPGPPLTIDRNPRDTVGAGTPNIFD